MTNIEKIKAACIKANQTKGWYWDLGVNDMREREQIQLSDVLMAVESEVKKGLISPKLKRKSEISAIVNILDGWDLTKTLEDQSQEKIDFIASLL
jgi:hypothetical protein